jgi:hypothetical protein
MAVLQGANSAWESEKREEGSVLTRGPRNDDLKRFVDLPTQTLRR